MAFKLNPNVSVVRDTNGSVVAIEHIQQPYSSGSGLGSSNPRTLGAEYLRNVSHVFGIPNSFLGNLNAPVAAEPTKEGITIRFAEEKSQHVVTTVSYVQTVLGLPIWESGFSVSVLPSPLRATSSVSSVKFDVKVHAPRPASTKLEKFTPEKLIGLLNTDVDADSPVKVTSTRFLVYRYDPAARQEGGEHEHPGGGSLVPGSEITLPLPPVPEEIRPGQYYVVKEILFTYPKSGFGDVNWRLFEEVETDSVLYLRAFASGAKGYVYLHDPITTINGPLPTASDADLDPLRTLVLLPGITPQNPQSLVGDYVKISELDPPVIPGPTDPAGHFLYDVDADGFAATNAYYHVESLFRKMTELGFDLSKLFSHTVQNPGFPVPVDQSAESGGINAHSWGNSTGNGSGGFIFGRAASSGTVGIAADFRIVCHEFCHAIVWDNLSSPNFGFAHGAGDSIGVMLSDPGSEAPDRGLTFPWITAIPRRHDRDVTQGWAWGGINHDKGYQSEQILSTTLFRAYPPSAAGRLRLLSPRGSRPKPGLRITSCTS